MYEIINRSSETSKRRRLRQETPPAERLLWARLRACQVNGLKFRRQHSVGCYVLDFYCPSCKLTIELDGDSHVSEAARKRDQHRDNYVNDFGILILRFANKDVFRDIDNVIERIAYAANLRSRPPLTPPSERRGT